MGKAVQSRDTAARAGWSGLAPLIRQSVERHAGAPWREQVREAIGLGLAIEGRLRARSLSGGGFPVRLTPYYAALLHGDALDTDPLAIQTLPDPRETAAASVTDCKDPFGEQTVNGPLPGVVHRFPDRVLVRFSECCAVNCRHCTRRHLLCPSKGHAPALETLIDHVRAHPQVREVILSGGDPLLCEDAELVETVERLAALPQIDALRIGTRAPVVLPMRIDTSLARALGRCRKLWINTQFNHPRELTPEASTACARLVDAGIPLSNQAVLLRGVNDCGDTLFDLCVGLQRIRVRPYYVFLCDPVTGTAHLRTPAGVACELADGLAPRLGGLALPRFVADVPGASAKVPVERLTCECSAACRAYAPFTRAK